MICVPSVTGTLAGYWRVRIGSMARALENQCITAMSSVVGAADWSEALGQSFGAGGIFCPPDRGFPAEGILGLRGLKEPGWTLAEADLAQGGRLLIRKSGTEPLVRVMAEHEDAALMERVADSVVAAVTAAVGR